MTQQDPNQPQNGKSFQNIQDLLKMDGSDGFDEITAERELAKMEERKRQVQEFKNTFAAIQASLGTDDYNVGVLRLLVTKGMTMLDCLQREIEDNPTGRDIETAAAMISSISAVVDNINNIKVSNAKIGAEQQKIDLKKINSGPSTNKETNNILMVGSTNELMDFLLKKKIIPDGNAPEPKTIDVQKEEPDKKES